MKKNSNYDVSSAGIIRGISLPESQRRAAAKFGLDISFNSKTLGISLLRQQDLVVIIANDVPRKIFENPLYNLKGKLVFWGIKDVKNLFNPDEKDSETIIKAIIKKADALIKQLEKSK